MRICTGYLVTLLYLPLPVTLLLFPIHICAPHLILPVTFVHLRLLLCPIDGRVLPIVLVTPPAFCDVGHTGVTICYGPRCHPGCCYICWASYGHVVGYVDYCPTLLFHSLPVYLLPVVVSVTVTFANTPRFGYGTFAVLRIYYIHACDCSTPRYTLLRLFPVRPVVDCTVTFGLPVDLTGPWFICVCGCGWTPSGRLPICC